MASLRDALARLLAVPGVRATVLVGRDGLLIETAGRGDQRFLDALAAHAASALGTTEALGQDLGHGHTVAALLEYEDAFITVDPLGEFAAVATLAESAASLGSVRQVLRAGREELLRLLDMR